MLRIQIGDSRVIPEHVFQKMEQKFREDKRMGNLPLFVAVIDSPTGEAAKVAHVTGIGRMEDGSVYADIGIDICLNIEDETGRIGYLLVKEEEGEADNV